MNGAPVPGWDVLLSPASARLLEERDGAVQLLFQVPESGMQSAEGEELFGTLAGNVADGVFEVFDVQLYGF